MAVDGDEDVLEAGQAAPLGKRAHAQSAEIQGGHPEIGARWEEDWEGGSLGGRKIGLIGRMGPMGRIVHIRPIRPIRPISPISPISPR